MPKGKWLYGKIAARYAAELAKSSDANLLDRRRCLGKAKLLGNVNTSVVNAQFAAVEREIKKRGKTL